jgi:hypothetical protein
VAGEGTAGGRGLEVLQTFWEFFNKFFFMIQKPPPPPAPPPPPPPPAPYRIPPRQYAQPPRPMPPRTAPPVVYVKQSSGGLTAVLIVLAVLAVTGIFGAGGYYLWQKSKQKSEQTADGKAGAQGAANDDDDDDIKDSSDSQDGKKPAGKPAGSRVLSGTNAQILAAMHVPTNDNMVRKVIDNPGLTKRDIQELENFNQGRITDICVVYVNRMRFDGSGYGGPQGLLNRANGIVADANKRFATKGVMGKLRLVGVVEVDYADVKKETDLNRIHSLRSGSDIVNPTLRNRLGADLVCLMVLKSSGGVAHTPGIYSVIGKARWPTSFTHEIQHNFGWKHGHGENLWTVKNNFPMNAKRLPQIMPYGKVFIQYRNKKEYKVGLL